MEPPFAPIPLGLVPVYGLTETGSGVDIVPDLRFSATIEPSFRGIYPVQGLAFVPPEDHAEITFFIDDSGSRTYTSLDALAWKASFEVNDETRVALFDGAWAGPYALVHDDGPWTHGGHEPRDAVAHDGVWSVSLWTPNDEDRTFEYGAIVNFDGDDGEWIWEGSNGSFEVPAGSEGPIEAEGHVMPTIPRIDLRLTLDVSELVPPFDGTPPELVTVIGSHWGWDPLALRDDGLQGDAVAGDGIYTLRLSTFYGPHDALLAEGDVLEFLFMLDEGHYKVDEIGQSAGAAAALLRSDSWEEVEIEVQDSGFFNLFLTVD
ncbi:MAG: hypothetical protein EA397_15905 [Deltaproteobacteria bacterium]|nr:MAG: hypothetical protein EA397_15905 [Deltaproteobacteria bacterium]